MSELQEHIQQYLNSIIYFNDVPMAINETNLHYLSQRAYSAFTNELNGRGISLRPDEHRNIILTVFPKEA